MAGAPPVVKGVYVCDDVLADPTRGKISLLNVFTTLRPPAGFPHELAKMSVLVGLRGARGPVRMRVEVVRAATDTVVLGTAERDIQLVDPLVTVYARFRLEKVRFPAPGRYTVEVFAGGEFLDDEVVTVLTGGG